MIAQILNFAIGIWLMAAPAVLGYGPPAATNDRIVGPIAGSFAFVALWEVARPLRWAVVPLGLWQVAAPWFLGAYPVHAIWNSVLSGLLLTALACVRGRIRQRFGTWD